MEGCAKSRHIAPVIRTGWVGLGLFFFFTPYGMLIVCTVGGTAEWIIEKDSVTANKRRSCEYS